MGGVVRFALRHSRLVIGAWILAIAACAILGFASRNSFTPTNLVIPGSEGERWFESTTSADFGNNVNVLLTGPEPALRRQGAELTKRLRTAPNVRVVSPFDTTPDGSTPSESELSLTRRDGSALLIVDVRLGRGDPLADSVIPVRAAIADSVRGPVTARITGQAAISDGMIEESYTATRKAEMIAVPLLIFVLLLVFRSPVAAAVPAVMGLGTVIAGNGIVQWLATLMNVDQVALSLASMMGLALGVDYSLLLVSRYREQRRGDPGAVAANIEAASRAAGRTILFAAVLLVAVMAAAAALSLGPILASAALGVGVATVFGALSSILVAPALLHLLDPWLERWRLPSLRRERTSRLARRQPVLVPIVALLLLLALAAPTLGIEPGSPDVELLPESSPARIDYQEVSKVVGPGFGAVFDVIVESKGEESIASRPQLTTVARLQRRLAADPGVAAVLGPAPIAGQTRRIAGLERGLSTQAKGLARLDDGLTRAADGSRQAGNGARALHDATGATERGAGQLAGGLRTATDGSDKLIGGLGTASSGSARLADGAQQASSGAGRLREGLDQARAESRGLSNNASVLEGDLRTGSDQLRALYGPLGVTEQRLVAALRALQRMTSGRDDPQFQPALQAIEAATAALTGNDSGSGDRLDPAYEGVAAGVRDADGQFSLGLYLTRRLERQGRESQRGVARLADGAAQLDDGVGRIAAGNEQLSGGLGQLWSRGRELPEGLGKLSDGAGQLAGGLGQVEEGAGKLAAGIGGDGAGSNQLTGGLQRMQAGIARQRERSQVGDLRKSAPGLFDSGFLTLAATDGAPRPSRERAELVLDATNGGRTARLIVVPRFASNDARVSALNDRIVAASRAVDDDRLETEVGGPGGLLQQFKDATSDRLPWLVVAFALISFAILALALRAVPLAAVCVVLNLLTVGVAFGVMQLAFGGSDPLLGGPGYVDVVALSGALAVVFALSIDYQVFLLGRIREEYVATGSNERALNAAIGSTAAVITGAAAVMVAVFLAFCTSEYIGIREVGVGLAVAVLLDATIVRLVLLPAVMRALDERTWWFPAWLDRRLPNVSL